MRFLVDLLLYSQLAAGLLMGAQNSEKGNNALQSKANRSSNARRCAAGKALLLSLSLMAEARDPHWSPLCCHASREARRPARFVHAP